MGQKEFVTAEGLRRDGRRAKELRRIKCQVGVLQSADGSAMFEVGNTQVRGALSVGDIWNLLFLWYLSRLQAASWCQAQLLPSLLLLLVV